MKEYSELMKRRPKENELYDVVVAGGGPAGIGAALAAAMSGAKTLILEARSQFGGTATAAMWMNFNFIFKDLDETDRGGVNRLLANSIREWGEVASIVGDKPKVVINNGGHLNIHPEYFKKVVFDLFDKFNIDYQLYSPVVDVIKESDTVKGLVVGAKEGKIIYRGKVFVDATGDGDVAYLAGCEMENYNPETEWRAPITLAFALCNVDTERLYKWLNEGGKEIDRHQFESFNEILKYANEEGYRVPSWIGFDRTNLPGVVSMNNGTSRNMQFNGSKSYDLTLIEKMGIDEALEVIRLAKDKKIPGLEDAKLMRTGGYVAVRETRRLKGEYTFTEKDVMEGTEFHDAVASRYGGRDPMGDNTELATIKQGAKYPYRSLLPRKIEGLLVAGRCGSASFNGHYGGKSMGNMLALGQAAGVAGSICAELNVTPKSLDYRLVQEGLEKLEVSL